MKIIIFLILLFPGFLFAQSESAGNGNEGGNGGDVVICRDSYKTNQPVLLDYFESNKKIKITGSEDPFDKVRIVLKRVAKHDPIRARLYEEGLNNFIEETIFIRNTRLPDISDEGWILARSRHQLAIRCIKQQAVIQIWRPDLNENYQSWRGVRKNRYYIDQNLWDNLLGTSDTKDIRNLNRYWSSANIIHTSTKEYEYRIQKLGFEVLRD